MGKIGEGKMEGFDKKNHRECFHCKSEMKRNERIEVTDILIRGTPRVYKSGWECPECGCIVFDN